MKPIDFYFDVISPYAYLAFEALPQALDGIDCDVRYKPILFAGLLKHFGQLGPAEIEPKRAWTYRHVTWLARRHGFVLDVPAAHPFNPLALLRLGWACAPAGGTPERSVCAALFRHVWQGGGAADDAQRIAALAQTLAPRCAPADPEVKQRLRAATEAAIGAGAFGVPALVADGRLFWGFDALPMLRAQLEGGAAAAELEAAWSASAHVAAGVQR